MARIDGCSIAPFEMPTVLASVMAWSVIIGQRKEKDLDGVLTI